MKQRILIFVYALMLCMGAKGVGVQTVDGLKFLVYSDYAVLVANNYTATQIEIPAKITYKGKELPVTSLGDICFSDCSSLTSVTIPSSVTSLGEKCFSGCSSLTSVTIPSSVTSLGESCFSGCSSLTSVTIPSSVTSLGEKCFSGCSSLASVTIPSSVTSLGDGCFSYCSSLTSVTIPSSVTILGISCFSGCSSLTSVTIPSSVTSLEASCFYYCSSLTSVTIPSSVTSLGYSCFEDCRAISDFTCLANTPPSVSSPYTFNGVPFLKAFLFVPEKSISAYRKADGWKCFQQVYPVEVAGGDDGEETQPCETPTIGYADGKLVFNSSTTGAEYHYTVKAVDNQTEAYSEGEAALAACYDISCYATADGYRRSDVATAKLYWMSASVVTDGITPGVQMRGVVISTDGGVVTLSGLADGERVTFYNVGGMKIGEAKAINGSASLAVADEVVIARIDTQTVKIKM